MDLISSRTTFANIELNAIEPQQVAIIETNNIVAMEQVTTVMMPTNEITKTQPQYLFVTSCKQLILNLRYYSALLIVILIPLFCLIPYMTGFYLNQVEPLFPLVSDVGSQIPQAPYLSTLIDLIAILGILTIVDRHYTVKRHISQFDASKATADPTTSHYLYRYSYMSLCALMASVIGMGILGNFRSSEALIGHTLGVILFFVGLMLMICFQIMIARRLSHHQLESRPISMIVILFLGLFCLTVCVTFQILSVLDVTSDQYTDIHYRLWWNSSQPGYLAHTLGSFFEWFAINSIALFFACLFNRSRLNRRQLPKANVNSSQIQV